MNTNNNQNGSNQLPQDDARAQAGENQATKRKRVAIKEIMANSNLNAQEKQLKIQELMSGHMRTSEESAPLRQRPGNHVAPSWGHVP